MLSQAVGIVSLVSEQIPCTLQARQQMGRNRAVRSITTSQHERERAADHVGKGMDFRGLPAARRADSLILRPPLPPCAERCALM